MPNRTTLFSCLFAAVLSIASANCAEAAGDYVWARTGWGVLPMGQYSSSMSNGYGGYYVPRNAYGNNFEGQGRFTNPGGYIVPAQTGTYPMHRVRRSRGRW